MTSWQKMIVKKDIKIIDAIRIIDSTGNQAVFVTDNDGKLIGSVTDGDIRRGFLANISFENGVEHIMNKKPITVHAKNSKNSIIKIMKDRHLRQIPIVDDLDRVVNIETLHQLLKNSEKENWVVLMAGGMGTRLHPLTQDCPKPLLRLGDTPIIEIILKSFIEQGFKKFYVSVNYKANMIEEQLGDGSKLDCEIRYLREDNRLGTAGPLGLISHEHQQPLIVMNADLLTKVNFSQLLDFHKIHQASATMCVRKYDFQVPYGVVEIDNHRITEISEKPVSSWFVNGGIYAINPDVLGFVPKNIFFDMPELFRALVERGHGTSAFPVHEYWLDIGRTADFEQAHSDYREIFSKKTFHA